MTDPQKPCRGLRQRGGAAVVELLVVVGVIVIFVGITMPKLSDAALERQQREEAVGLVVFEVRSKLEVYRQQHGRYPEGSEFEVAMTGSTVRGGLVLGPYLREVPVNPLTGGRKVGDGDAGTSDWYYDERRGEFAGNHVVATGER